MEAMLEEANPNLRAQERAKVTKNHHDWATIEQSHLICLAEGATAGDHTFDHLCETVKPESFSGFVSSVQ